MPCVSRTRPHLRERIYAVGVILMTCLFGGVVLLSIIEP